jgi:hypothetical protein
MFLEKRKTVLDAVEKPSRAAFCRPEKRRRTGEYVEHPRDGRGRRSSFICSLLGKFGKAIALGWMCPVLACCSTTTVQPPPNLEAHASWVVLPMLNIAQSPLAGQRVESIVAALLRARGIAILDVYRSVETGNALPELDDRRAYEKALVQARSRHHRYGIAGSVEEWHYKSSAAGEPAVGLTISVVDVATGQVLWTATGARTGWGRDTTVGVAQELLKELLDDLNIT